MMYSVEKCSPPPVELRSTEVDTSIADGDVDRHQLLVSLSLREGGKKGSEFPFPVKLHFMLNDLEKQGLDDIMSWLPDGKGFIIHKPTEVAKKVLPYWFRQKCYGSFQRQLNLYCFERIKSGSMKGGYHHGDLFVRGKLLLSYRIKREPVKSARRCNHTDHFNDRTTSMPWMSSKTSCTSLFSSFSNGKEQQHPLSKVLAVSVEERFSGLERSRRMKSIVGSSSSLCTTPPTRTFSRGTTTSSLSPSFALPPLKDATARPRDFGSCQSTSIPLGCSDDINARLPLMMQQQLKIIESYCNSFQSDHHSMAKQVQHVDSSPATWTSKKDDNDTNKRNHDKNGSLSLWACANSMESFIDESVQTEIIRTFLS